MNDKQKQKRLEKIKKKNRYRKYQREKYIKSVESA